MGSIVFLIPRSHPLSRQAVDCAYMVGSDGIPWETQVVQRGDRLTVTRDTQESGRLVIPWRTASGRDVALSTATLLSSDAPYHLPLELSRGTINQLQSQVALWESRGLPASPAVREGLADALGHFVRASLSRADVDRCADDAEAALNMALQQLDHWGRYVVDFSATNLSGQASPGLWGVRLAGSAAAAPPPAAVAAPFSYWFVRATWRSLEPSPGEWNEQSLQQTLQTPRPANVRLACGPLLCLSRDDLPDWLYLWDNDFETIHSYVVSYVSRVVRRLSGRVGLWHCAASTNVEDALHLSEEQRLRLTVSAVETLRQADPRTPAIVSIQQPWGEYLGRAACDLSPWQFADILVRGELGLSGIGLELSVGCRPGKTLTRSLLEFSRLIDRWSVFGLPLVLFLSLPTATAADSSDNLLDLAYVQDLLKLFATRSSVHGIVWEQLSDDPDWPAGLVDAQGRVKPILGVLQQLAR